MGWKRISRHETEWEGNNFIRVGHAVGTAGQLKGEATFNRGPSSNFYAQGTRRGIGVSWVICWLDEARIRGGGKSRANTFSLWARRGDRLYRSINSYNRQGQEGWQGSGYPLPASQDPPWFYLCFCPWFTTLSSGGQECRHHSWPIATTFERPGARRYRAHPLWGSLNHNHKPTWSAADVSQLATSPHAAANSPRASTKTPPAIRHTYKIFLIRKKDKNFKSNFKTIHLIIREIEMEAKKKEPVF